MGKCSFAASIFVLAGIWECDVDEIRYRVKKIHGIIIQMCFAIFFLDYYRFVKVYHILSHHHIKITFIFEKHYFGPD